MFRRAGFNLSPKLATKPALRSTQRLVSRLALVAALLLASTAARGAPDQAKPGEPTDPKALKTFKGAADSEKHDNLRDALDGYRKANKQDGGHCTECLSRAYSLA